MFVHQKAVLIVFCGTLCDGEQKLEQCPQNGQIEVVHRHSEDITAKVGGYIFHCEADGCTHGVGQDDFAQFALAVVAEGSGNLNQLAGELFAGDGLAVAHFGGHGAVEAVEHGVVHELFQQCLEPFHCQYSRTQQGNLCRRNGNVKEEGEQALHFAVVIDGLDALGLEVAGDFIGVQVIVNVKVGGVVVSFVGVAGDMGRELFGFGQLTQEGCGHGLTGGEGCGAKRKCHQYSQKNCKYFFHIATPFCRNAAFIFGNAFVHLKEFGSGTVYNNRFRSPKNH